MSLVVKKSENLIRRHMPNFTIIYNYEKHRSYVYELIFPALPGYLFIPIL
jgi:hypothetical protein